MPCFPIGHHHLGHLIGAQQHHDARAVGRLRADHESFGHDPDVLETGLLERLTDLLLGVGRNVRTG
jgi:hypothetical protein